MAPAILTPDPWPGVKINENLEERYGAGARYVKNQKHANHPAADSGGPEQKAAKAKALEYMSAVPQVFYPTLTKTKSAKSCKTALPGKKSVTYADTEGAIRLCGGGQRRKRTDLRC